MSRIDSKNTQVPTGARSILKKGLRKTREDKNLSLGRSFRQPYSHYKVIYKAEKEGRKAGLCIANLQSICANPQAEAGAKSKDKPGNKASTQKVQATPYRSLRRLTVQRDRNVRAHVPCSHVSVFTWSTYKSFKKIWADLEVKRSSLHPPEQVSGNYYQSQKTPAPVDREANV